MSSVKSLNKAFEVDHAINASKLFVIIRFGVTKDCNEVDEWINEDAAAISKFAEIYKVERKVVPELVARYSLFGPCSIVFFHNGRVVSRLSTAKIKEERQNKKSFAEIANNIRDDVLSVNIKISQ